MIANQNVSIHVFANYQIRMNGLNVTMENLLSHVKGTIVKKKKAMKALKSLGLVLYAMMIHYVQTLRGVEKLHFKMYILQNMNQLAELKNHVLMKLNVDKWLYTIRNNIRFIALLLALQSCNQ